MHYGNVADFEVHFLPEHKTMQDTGYDIPNHDPHNPGMREVGHSPLLIEQSAVIIG